MRVAVYRDPSELEAVAEQWDELALASEAPSVYNSSEYLLAGWRHLVSGRQLCVPALLDESGRLVGAVPLRFRHVGRSVRLERAVRREFDRFGLLARAGDEEKVWIELLPTILGLPWDSWELDWVVDGSPIAALLQDSNADDQFEVKVTSGADGYLVDVAGDWEEFVAGHKSFRRRLRRFERDVPDAVIDVYDRPDNVLQGLDHYLQVDRLSWKAGKIGVSRSASSEDFYREVLPLLAAKDRTAVRVLRSGDSLIGADITHVFGDTAFLHCSVYANEWRSHSPGTVFTGYVLRELMESKIVRADFLTGFAEYMGSWISETISTHTITVTRSPGRLDPRRAVAAIRSASRKATKSRGNRPLGTLSDAPNDATLEIVTPRASVHGECHSS